MLNLKVQAFNCDKLSSYMMNEKAVQFVTILTRGQGVSSICIEPHTPVPCLDVSPPPPPPPPPPAHPPFIWKLAGITAGL